MRPLQKWEVDVLRQYIGKSYFNENIFLINFFEPVTHLTKYIKTQIRQEFLKFLKRLPQKYIENYL